MIDLFNYISTDDIGKTYYSLIHGDIKLISIDDNNKYPFKFLKIDVNGPSMYAYATRYGQFYYGCGECIIFPSVDDRTWNNK